MLHSVSYGWRTASSFKQILWQPNQITSLASSFFLQIQDKNSASAQLCNIQPENKCRKWQNRQSHSVQGACPTYLRINISSARYFQKIPQLVSCSFFPSSFPRGEKLFFGKKEMTGKDLNHPGFKVSISVSVMDIIGGLESIWL